MPKVVETASTQWAANAPFEVAVDEIGCLTRPIAHRRDWALATAHACQADVAHQPGPFATDTDAGFGKINPRRPSGARAEVGRFTHA